MVDIYIGIVIIWVLAVGFGPLGAWVARRISRRGAGLVAVGGI